jgi:glutaredoxin 3
MRQKHLCNIEGATMQIVIYTKSNCPNCTSAKRLMDSKGIGYTEMDFDDVGIQYVFTQQYPEAKQMPQCFIQGQRVGGLTGLQAALKEMGL